MHVLIVESNAALGKLWQKHLERQGCEVTLVHSGDDAVNVLRRQPVQIIVMDVVLDEGSSLAVADFASFRQPSARIVFVTNTSFFSDGSIFEHAPNACAFLRTATPVEDLGAIVEHYGERAI